MRLSLTACATLWIAAYSVPAHAYLDPGTGSMMLQMLIGGIAAAAFTLKMYWAAFKQKCAALFGKRSSADASPPANEE